MFSGLAEIVNAMCAEKQLQKYRKSQKQLMEDQRDYVKFKQSIKGRQWKVGPWEWRT